MSYARNLKYVSLIFISFVAPMGCAKKPLVPSYQQLDTRLLQEYTIQQPPEDVWVALRQVVDKCAKCSLLSCDDDSRVLSWFVPNEPKAQGRSDDTQSRTVKTAWVRAAGDHSVVRFSCFVFEHQGIYRPEPRSLKFEYDLAEGLKAELRSTSLSPDQLDKGRAPSPLGQSKEGELQ